ALAGVLLGAGVGVAAVQVELPARLLPAVEAGVGDELDPPLHRHVAELPAHQPDLVVGILAVAVRLGLLEAHRPVPFRLPSITVRDRDDRRLYRRFPPPQEAAPLSVGLTLRVRKPPHAEREAYAPGLAAAPPALVEQLHVLPHERMVIVPRPRRNE